MIDKIFTIDKISKENAQGIIIKVLWIFTFTILQSAYRGDHISFGIGIAPLEISIQFSIWYHKEDTAYE
jgi:hypothetical protein